MLVCLPPRRGAFRFFSFGFVDTTSRGALDGLRPAASRLLRKSSGFGGIWILCHSFWNSGSILCMRVGSLIHLQPRLAWTSHPKKSDVHSPRLLILLVPLDEHLLPILQALELILHGAPPILEVLHRKTLGRLLVL